MKRMNNRWNALMMSCLVLGSAVATVQVSRAEENIIKNGNFETSDGSSQFPGWTLSGDASYLKIIEENGNHFLRIDVPKTTYCGVKQTFDVGSDWNGLEISARVRLQNLQKGPEGHNTATVLYTFNDAQGQHVGSWSQKMIMQDQDWTEIKDTVSEIPPGAVSLVFMVSFMNASGVLDVDDVVVTPVK